MRFLVPLLLVTAASAFVAVPAAGACHVVAIDPTANIAALDGYYLVRNVDYGGCPHKLTVCVGVWRESNGQPGLQPTDTPVLVACPYP